MVSGYLLWVLPEAYHLELGDMLLVLLKVLAFFLPLISLLRRWRCGLAGPGVTAQMEHFLCTCTRKKELHVVIWILTKWPGLPVYRFFSSFFKVWSTGHWHICHKPVSSQCSLKCRHLLERVGLQPLLNRHEGWGRGKWEDFLRPTPSPILPLAYRSTFFLSEFGRP